MGITVNIIAGIEFRLLSAVPGMAIRWAAILVRASLENLEFEV